MKRLLLLSLVFSWSAMAHQELTPADRTLVRFAATQEVKDYLRTHDLDVAGIDVPNNEIEALLTRDQLAELELMKTSFKFQVPQVMLRAPDPEYMNPTEVEAALRDYAARYPDLTELKVVGESLEKRPIYAIKISDNPRVRETDEPVALFNGMHHAREVMTPEVAIDIVDYLLKNYASDNKVREWVDTNEIWVMPMFNVDGNNRMWTRDSMWRKNTRGGYGVDLNRNYPAFWNTCNGSSGSTWSDTYRGPTAASEPETNVMMKLVTDIRPVFNISYHSYSELVIYPYGCENRRVQTAAVVESIGKEMGRLLSYTAGTSWETLYNTDGGDIDWMYQAMQVIPFVIEVNKSSQGGFHPDYARWRNATVEKNRVGWQLLLNRLHGSGVRGMITGVSEKTVIEVLDSAGKVFQNYTVNPDGTYHIVLNPGTFTLNFKTERTVLGSRSVTVADRLVVVNQDF